MTSRPGMALAPLPRNMGGPDQKVICLFPFPLAIAPNCLLPMHINMTTKQIEDKVSKNRIIGKTKAQIRTVRSFARGVWTTHE